MQQKRSSLKRLKKFKAQRNQEVFSSKSDCGKNCEKINWQSTQEKTAMKNYCDGDIQQRKSL